MAVTQGLNITYHLLRLGILVVVVVYCLRLLTIGILHLGVQFIFSSQLCPQGTFLASRRKKESWFNGMHELFTSSRSVQQPVGSVPILKIPLSVSFSELCELVFLRMSSFSALECTRVQLGAQHLFAAECNTVHSAPPRLQLARKHWAAEIQFINPPVIEYFKTSWRRKSTI